MHFMVRLPICEHRASADNAPSIRVCPIWFDYMQETSIMDTDMPGRKLLQAESPKKQEPVHSPATVCSSYFSTIPSAARRAKGLTNV